MEKSIHSYNACHYFETTPRVFGWIISIWALVAVLGGSIAAFLALPVGVLMQFSFHRVEFDLLNRTYKEGVRICGLTFGKQLPLPGTDFLYLNKNSYNQRAESRASSMEHRGEKYDGYVKLAGTKKLHLVKKYSKEKAMHKMEKISDDLGIELRDQTDIKYY
ncbi:hypothetical protein [Pontibacter populi]|uniref:Uncharacterized protein n=1 Tax=Pontibacter populi TaxID=890055 RepID=A0ABV1RUG1_9BACT